MKEIQEIIDYLVDVHSKNADGCKGSCNERCVGYHNSTYYDSYWFVQFGGYCLGDLSRSEEVRANSLQELLPALKLHIEAAIARSEAVE